MKELTDVGFDVGGPHRARSLVGLGIVRPHRRHAVHAQRRSRSHQARKHRVQDLGAADQRDPPGVSVLPRQQGEERPRRQPVARGAETTWDQTGPTPLYKGQVNISARNDLFLTVRAGHVGNGFSLTPQGGLDTTGYRDAGRVRHGSYVFYETKRPDNSVLADGNWFRGHHEIAFGGSWRHTKDDERQEFPGSGADNLHATDFATSRRITAYLYRPFFASSVGVNQSLYVGDTIHGGRVTAQFSLRFDRSYASMLESAQAAIPGFPTLLPAIVAPAEDKMIDISLFSPRARPQLRARRERAHAAARQLRPVRIAARHRHGAVVLGGVAGAADLLGHRSQRQQRRRSERARDAAELRRRRSGASGVGRELQPHLSGFQGAEDA